MVASIRTHLFLRFLLVSLLAILSLSIFHLIEIESYFRESTEDGLVEYSTLLGAMIENRLMSETEGELEARMRIATQDLDRILQAGRVPSAPASIFGVVKSEIKIHVYVTDHRGIVIYDSRSSSYVGQDFSRWNDVARVLQGRYGARTTVLDDSLRSSMTLYVAAPVQVQDKIVGVISAGKALSGIELLIRKEKHAVAAVAVTVAVLIGLITFLVSRSIANPLAKLRQFALDLSEGRTAPLPQLPFTELTSLSQAIDHLRRKLDGRSQIQKVLQQFTHELKSPLTAVASAAELMHDPLPDEARQRFSKVIINQIHRALGLVDRQLSLSKLEANPIVSKERINVNELIIDIVDLFSDAAALKQVSMVLDSGDKHSQVWTLASRDSLTIVFTNVIQNALDFTRAGGSIAVSISTPGDILEIAVVDSGVGIPEYAFSRLFEGYYSSERPDSRERGTGLGLKISREILTQIGGTLELRNVVPHGCSAIIRLLQG
jgi:two-component system sensor histidine kinase CreC